jgi:hypothetical protein
MMNKTALKAIVMTILLTVVVIVASPSYAQGNGFVETFDDSTLSGWEKDGDIIVESGILKMSPPSLLLKRGTWSNITLTVIFRFETEGFAVIDYYVGEGQHYSLTILPTTIFLEKIVGGTPERLWETSEATLFADWNTITIGFDGTTHSITLNETLLSTVTDSSPLSSGGVRLHVPAGSAVEFDSLTLQSQTGEELPPGEGQLEEAPPAGEPGTEPAQEPPTEGEPSGALPATEDTGGTAGSELTLIEEFFSSQATNLELSTFAINLLLAVISSFILSRVYIHWGSSLSNRRVFAANFMLMTVTTTFIILVVRSSVALSLGLVGALSIVRFRAAVKEPEELAYLFFAISLGIGLGDNQRLITLLTLLVAIILVGLMKLFRNTKADVNLHLTISSNSPNKVDLDQIMNVLEKHCAKMKLLRFDENPDSLETSFVIEFKRVSNLNQAKAELQTLSDTLDISFLDNRGIW